MSGIPKKKHGICDECGSRFLKAKSVMTALCPECAHRLYDYPKCHHNFKYGTCVHCGWDGSASKYTSNDNSE